MNTGEKVKKLRLEFRFKKSDIEYFFRMHCKWNIGRIFTFQSDAMNFGNND